MAVVTVLVRRIAAIALLVGVGGLHVPCAVRAQAPATILAVEQDGKVVTATNGEVLLQRRPFVLVITMPRSAYLYGQVSESAAGFELSRSGAPLLSLFPDGGGLAEGDRNADKNLFLSDSSNSAFHVWFYENESDHRFDRVAVEGTKLTARRTVQTINAPDGVAHSVAAFPGKTLYVTAEMRDPASRKVLGTAAMKITLEGAPYPPGRFARTDDARPPRVPLRVGADISPPEKIKDVPPVYPQDAVRARVTGQVVVEATISETGEVVDATVLRSIPLLDQAALDAVRQWRFRPVHVDGIPVPVVMTVTVTFSLK